ncbi:1-acylglycerol-3-phosphate O-acyltransferase [Entomortierella lignicola]|nr:1-acylglycerol-3-phosphate O-acyltransferase [Entomortierella lignicola]
MSIVSKLSSHAGNALIAGAVYVTLPQILANLPPRTQFLAKYIVYILSVMGMSVVGSIISIFCTLMGKRYLSNYLGARLFSRVTSIPCGIKFNVKGEERLKHSPAVVVCNHQSNLDIVAIGRVYPENCAIMAKKELLWVPFLNMFIKLANVVLVDRANHKSAVQAATQAIIDIRKSNSGMWVFPEGTRSHFDKPGLLPFKKGAFRLAIQGQYPVLPIVIESYSHVYNSKKQHFPGGEIEIRVLEPIPTKGLTLDDMDSLIERTRAVMLKNLYEMAGIDIKPLPPTPPKIEASTEEFRPRL